MIEGAELAGTSKAVLVFRGNASAAAAWIIPIGLFVFCAITLANAPSATGGGAVVGCLLVAIVFSLIAMRRQIAEIDLNAGTLRIFRQYLGRWTKTIVNCSLDRCRQLGRIEYETEGHLSYGVYIELADGTRHAIPLEKSTFAETGRVASQLSDATGIPRTDIRF
jgi:hypothetical protein